VRGLGSRVWDQSGRELIDFAGGIAVNLLGHAHPALVEALTEQANKLWHVSNVFTNEPALRLAHKLDATFAERVLLQLRRRSQRGRASWRAVATMFATAREVRDHRHGQQLPRPYPVHRQRRWPVEVLRWLRSEDHRHHPRPYNDLEALKAAISDKTCAVVIEPIQGESGVLPADKAYLEGARALRRAQRADLRRSAAAWAVPALYAYQHYGVTPDILTSAKSLGGGFPIGAMLTTEAGQAPGGRHPRHHLRRQPAGCAVSGAVIDVINTLKCWPASAKHERFKARLERSASNTACSARCVARPAARLRAERCLERQGQGCSTPPRKKA
jgi:acetylornithine/N-succinyldiaminopimelate aminotransferase